MSTITTPDEATPVEVLPWEDFLPWWSDAWEPGQHVGIVGPTGSGKTTLEFGLCQTTDYVLAIDPKGGDQTLAASGWRRVTTWPPPSGVIADIKDGEPARLIVGKVAKSRAQRDANRRLLARVMPSIWEQGGWTVIIDELQILTDRRFFNLADDTVELLIAARNRGISVVSALQRVSIGNSTGGASSTVGDQVTWLAVAYTRDDRMVQRLAELLGRPVAEVREVIRALPLHSWLMVGRDPRQPFRVTRPPKLSVPSLRGTPPRVTWREKLFGR